MNNSNGKSSNGGLIGGLVGGLGGAILGPGTLFGILACFFKPTLRRVLVRLGFRRTADTMAPGEGLHDMRTDMEVLYVRIAEMQGFLAKQKLPRLVDTTPELPAADVKLDASQPIGRGGFATVYGGTLGGARRATPAPRTACLVFCCEAEPVRHLPAAGRWQ